MLNFADRTGYGALMVYVAVYVMFDGEQLFINLVLPIASTFVLE